ncbi:MAG: ammonium transporter [Rhizobiales bacterium]|nr:ammonium transporter [Hyphomicrobiales bacterium]
MTFKKLIGAGFAALAAAVFAVEPAFAQDAAINKADTVWMMVSAIVVLLMTVPGLALFYGGLVRSKNMLSMLMQIGYTVAIVILIWVVYGYSLAFTGGSDFIGGFSKAFLSGIANDTKTVTFSDRVALQELVFIMFQATFAAITASLLLGATAERLKFAAVAVFIPLWVTFVYFPVAHMVWYWPGPDALVDAAKAVAVATGDAKVKAQAALDALQADAGYIFKLGALDFAGGTVVHINSGIAGLVGALIVGKRLGYGKELMPPHSLVMTYIGAMMLWFGWFGFNAGSNLEASGSAINAFVNTFVATAAAAISWTLIEWLIKGKPSLLGLVSGIVAGLVAITPAAGFAGAMGALVLGLLAGVVCFFFCTVVKNAFKYDDALDVFGIHAVGGILGAIGTGIVAAPSLGGVGITDYTGPILKVESPAYDIFGQVLIQAQGVGVTILWSGIISAVLFYIVKMLVGLRPTPDQEREGLDITDHGERAYN